jgi:hypothetical protein
VTKKKKKKKKKNKKKKKKEYEKTAQKHNGRCARLLARDHNIFLRLMNFERPPLLSQTVQLG